MFGVFLVLTPCFALLSQSFLKSFNHGLKDAYVLVSELSGSGFTVGSVVIRSRHHCQRPFSRLLELLEHDVLTLMKRLLQLCDHHLLLICDNFTLLLLLKCMLSQKFDLGL